MSNYINADSVLRWWENCNKIISEENKAAIMTGQSVIEYVKALMENCAKATIVMKFADGKEYEYGTYDYNTPLEKVFVNELAERVRDERRCEVEVRVE